MDTIYAVSSGAPPAAIAVLRISGPLAMQVAERLGGSLPPPRTAGLRKLHAPDDGSLLDHALMLVFPGPNTATGEDLVELHLHGGRAVVAAVSAVLARQPGLRPAEPGEFTRRALTNGRIDLAEAEGLGDLLMAETEAQRRRAIAAADGVISRMVAEWSARLLQLSAHVEAVLDFSDEDDVGDPACDIPARIGDLARDIDRIVAQPPVDRLRDGVRVVLAGPPNSGKSTLINAMATREAAIVSPIAGTTRDRIEVPVVRNGIAYVLIDTAGLVDATDDPIERIGISRAQAAIDEADIVLWLGDEAPPARPATIALYPRADLRGPSGSSSRISLSAKTGEGMDALWRAIGEMAITLLPREDEVAVNQRQRGLLATAVGELEEAAALNDLLLIAEHLRHARAALDAITGITDVESMLDTLFGRFCIGK